MERKTNRPAFVAEHFTIDDQMNQDQRRKLARYNRHVAWRNFKARVWRFFHPRQCATPNTSQA